MSLLAERIDELLDEVLRRTAGHRVRPPACRVADDAPLDLPLLEDFRVGAIGLAWDGDGGLVVIEAQEESDEPAETLAEEVPRTGRGAAGADRAGSRARVRPAGRQDRRGRAAALPAVRPAAGHRRAHLPRRTATAAAMRDQKPRSRDGRRAGRSRPARARRAGDRGAAGRRVQRHAVLHDQDGGRGSRGEERPDGRGSVTETLRVQAGRGRAAAVGFPDRHAGRPGGRRLRGVPRGRLGRRPADGHAGRADGSGHVPAVDRPRPQRGPDRPVAPHRSSGPARHGRVRRGTGSKPTAFNSTAAAPISRASCAGSMRPRPMPMRCWRPCAGNYCRPRRREQQSRVYSAACDCGLASGSMPSARL